MSLSIKLPLQSTQYIATSNCFNGTFNTPVAGKYSFDIAANRNAVVLDLQLNSYYLIERMFISGNVPAEDFLAALDFSSGVSLLPSITIKRKLHTASIHRLPLPVYQFTDSRETPMLFKSDKKDDQLLMSFTGQMNQTAALVGVNPLTVTIGLSIYEISEAGFNIGFRSALNPSFGLDKNRSF